MNNFTPVFILNELVILPGQEIKIDLTNEMSKKIIKVASKTSDNKVLVIAPKNVLEISPVIEDFPKIGVIAKIKSKLELSNGSLRITLRGINRVVIEKYYQNKSTGILKCDTNNIELPKFDVNKENALRRKLISLTKEYIENNKTSSNSIIKSIDSNNNLDYVTDIIISFMPFSFVKKSEYMENINPLKRADNLIVDLQDEISICNIDRELDEKLQDNLENGQREYILKEKLKEINKELGYSKEEEINNLIEIVNGLNLNYKTSNKLLNEIKKYEIANEYSPECAIIKNYIDTLLNLPWNNVSQEESNIKKISITLNDRHYGLTEVKNRIIEYIEIKNNNNNIKSPIICLVGPPGVGKTSIAMSIANSLNREFYKISVGGLNDSTELIGSRRTYVGAAPGRIMQGIIKCGVKNPLILIDEVDKMVKDYKGDPAATLLEILDETQNKYFIDNYIEEEFDLSNVLFILTANEIDKIPNTLKDRLEIINLESYSIFEKIDIAKNYLLKDIFREYNTELKVTKEVLEYIVHNYTKEPGVRELKYLLEKLVRKILVYEKDAKSITISLTNKYLTKKENNYLPTIRDYGISNILAYTNMGGQISHVEVSRSKGTGKINITGSCGDVLKESVQVVVSLLKSEYDINVNDYDLHIHFLSASQKKEGPSAGVSVACAVLSIFERKVLPNDVAFTGEISLKGNILPIGGLKEKIIAAIANNITTVYVPSANIQEINEIDDIITKQINVKMVDNFSEIYDELFR